MSKIIRWIFIIFGLLILLLIFVGWFLYEATPDRLNILVVGSDQRGEERARSDVLMVVSLPKHRPSPTTILTIPRDTRVDVPGFGMQKITHAYALGDRKEGSVLGNIDLTQKTVENFLGIRQQGTVEVTFDSFVEIVDMMGGVDISSGHINGEQALKIVRDRFREGGDFARTEDQREVLLALVSKIKSPDMASLVYDYFSTHPESRLQFSRTQIGLFGAFWFLSRGGKISLGEVSEQVVPGHGASLYTPEYNKELYYWVPDEAALKILVDQYLR